MSLLPSAHLLEKTLRVVPRRYRLPPLDAASARLHEASPATRLAIVIEQARQALVRREMPEGKLKRTFVQALAEMIHQAMRPDGGDPVFQAMVLRHRAAQVREYASLSAHAGRDRRQIHAAVNAIAHPGKQQQLLASPLREQMAKLRACASSSSWSVLHDTVGHLLEVQAIGGDSPIGRGLTRLLHSPALQHLRRLEALTSDELVRQYRSLWERHGPRSGTATAIAQGLAAKQRGAAAEASATQALAALARRLDAAEGVPGLYRAVSSMRVPASIPGSHERAKTEWDVVLLRQANTSDETAVWDVCLLVEAKASVDAATTDFPRLIRGVRLLAHAQEDGRYSFETGQGTVRLRGASLRSLTTDAESLAGTVLYCCDGPAEDTPRLLGAASRMQLLSAQGSLEFANAVAEKGHGEFRELESVWSELLELPPWRAVLDQYSMLCQVRELMVRAEDLMDAIDGGAEGR